MTTPTLKFMTVDGEVELPLEYAQSPRMLSEFCEGQVKRTLASSLPDEQVALLLACLACGIGFTTRERALEVLHIAQDIHPTRAAACRPIPGGLVNGASPHLRADAVVVASGPALGSGLLGGEKRWGCQEPASASGRVRHHCQGND